MFKCVQQKTQEFTEHNMYSLLKLHIRISYIMRMKESIYLATGYTLTCIISTGKTFMKFTETA